MTTCPICERPMTVLDRRQRVRKTCSRPCAVQWAAMIRRDRIDPADVELLLTSGALPEQIATRLGRHPDSIARAMHRLGRTELARPFWSASWHQRAAS